MELEEYLIADQKNKIEQLQRDLELKERALSLVTHDIRGVTQNLKWVIDSIANKEVPQELLFAMLPELKSEIKTNQRTIDHVLHWIKYAEKERELDIQTIMLHDLYNDLVERLGIAIKSKGLHVKYEGDRSLTIRTDKYLISFILMRVLENAVKYSYSEGNVRFSVANAADDTIKISVIDEGMGIENIDKLFSFDGPRFTGTEGEKGAGLSLIIVKQLCDRLGITITAVSEPVGTKFELYIPTTTN